MLASSAEEVSSEMFGGGVWRFSVLLLLLLWMNGSFTLPAVKGDTFAAIVRVRLLHCVRGIIYFIHTSISFMCVVYPFHSFDHLFLLLLYVCRVHLYSISSFIHIIYCVTFIHSFIHSYIFVYAFYSFPYSFIHSFIHWKKIFHSFTHLHLPMIIDISTSLFHGMIY